MTAPLENAVAGFNSRLLASGSRMNRMSAHEMGSELEAGFRELGQVLGADCTVLSAFFPDGPRLETKLVYPASGSTSFPETPCPSKLPFIMTKITSGDIAVLHFPRDLPEEAHFERALLMNPGIRSAVIFPVISSGALSYLVSLFFLRESFGLEEVLHLLRPAADFLAGAYARRQALLHREELNRFETLLSEISSSYINLPVDAVDRAVTHDLERLSCLMDADRYNILLLEDSRKNSSRMLFSYTWGPEVGREQRDGDAWLEAHGGHELFRYITDHCLKGQAHSLSNIEELPETEVLLKEGMHRLGVKSHLAVPISVNREVIGLMIILTTRRHRDWPADLIRKVRQFGDLFANAFVRKRSEEARRAAHEEIKRLKSRIESDYRYLSDEFMKAVGGESIFGNSPALNRVMEQILQVAPTQTPVLLLGETGSGKGMLARALHQSSRRGSRPLVQLNCATLASGLIESELFGHERGAFTGADKQRAGRFEIAEGTTLFLDEIGEIPLSLQAKLLRVLETGEYERLGGSRTLKTDARIIAATNRDLERETEEGRFRRDLWYRLSIFPIPIPPLRERAEDIPAIAEGFVERFSRLSGKHFDPISKDIMTALRRYPWPGNVRELRNLIERAVIVSPPGELCITLPKHPASPDCAAVRDEVKPFADMERSYLLHALRQAGWRIEGPGGAADLLGLNASTLRSRMRKLGIRKAASVFE